MAKPASPVGHASVHSRPCCCRLLMISLQLRQFILRRDNFTCQLCHRTRFDKIKLEVDHKRPASKGGTDDPANLWTLCFQCNRGKVHHWDDSEPTSAGRLGYFVIRTADGGLSTCGRVLEQNPEYLKVQLIEFLLGTYDVIKFVDWNEARKWDFYETESEMECRAKEAMFITEQNYKKNQSSATN